MIAKIDSKKGDLLVGKKSDSWITLSTIVPFLISTPGGHIYTMNGIKF